MQFLIKIFIVFISFFHFNIFAAITCSQNGTAVLFVNGYDINDKDIAYMQSEKLKKYLVDKTQLDSKSNVNFDFIFLDRLSYLKTEAEKTSAIQKELDLVRREFIKRNIQPDKVFELLLKIFKFVGVDFGGDPVEGVSEDVSRILAAGMYRESVIDPARLDVLRLIHGIRTKMFKKEGLGVKFDQKVIIVAHGEAGDYIKQARPNLFDPLYPENLLTQPLPSEMENNFPHPSQEQALEAPKYISTALIGTLREEFSSSNKEVYRNFQVDGYIQEFATNLLQPNISALPNELLLTLISGHDFSLSYLGKDHVRESNTDLFHGTLGGVREAAEKLESNCTEETSYAPRITYSAFFNNVTSSVPVTIDASATIDYYEKLLGSTFSMIEWNVAGVGTTTSNMVQTYLPREQYFSNMAKMTFENGEEVLALVVVDLLSYIPGYQVLNQIVSQYYPQATAIDPDKNIFYYFAADGLTGIDATSGELLFKNLQTYGENILGAYWMDVTSSGSIVVVYQGGVTGLQRRAAILKPNGELISSFLLTNTFPIYGMNLDKKNNILYYTLFADDTQSVLYAANILTGARTYQYYPTNLGIDLLKIEAVPTFLDSQGWLVRAGIIYNNDDFQPIRDSFAVRFNPITLQFELKPIVGAIDMPVFYAIDNQKNLVYGMFAPKNLTNSFFGALNPFNGELIYGFSPVLPPMYGQPKISPDGNFLGVTYECVLNNCGYKLFKLNRNIVPSTLL